MILLVVNIGEQRPYRIIIKCAQRYHVHSAFDIPNIMIGERVVRLTKFFKWQRRFREFMYR